MVRQCAWREAAVVFASDTYDICEWYNTGSQILNRKDRNHLIHVEVEGCVSIFNSCFDFLPMELIETAASNFFIVDFKTFKLHCFLILMDCFPQCFVAF